MFYCRKCRVKNQWPESTTGSYSMCEVCGSVDFCNNIPSRNLDPKPKRRLKLDPIRLKTIEYR